jgi:hypothetical protein
MKFDYSTTKETYCNLPTSGSPEVGSEVYTNNGGSVGMPVTVYGYSDPTTNNGLRIKGAAGWVPWNTSLSTGQTGYYDERYGQPGCNQPGDPPCLYYNIYYVGSYYKFEGYGQDP